MTNYDIPAPEQRVRDYLDAIEGERDYIDEVRGPVTVVAGARVAEPIAALTSGDINDVLKELDYYRDKCELYEAGLKRVAEKIADAMETLGVDE